MSTLWNPYVPAWGKALTRAVLPPRPPDSGLEVLAVQRVSKTQAWQRTGRAGREDSGVCYRLYTEDEFEKFEKMTVPEIQRWVPPRPCRRAPGLGVWGRWVSRACAPHRCNLASVLLQLLAMRVPDVLTFDFMSKPSPGRQSLGGWAMGGRGPTNRWALRKASGGLLLLCFIWCVSSAVRGTWGSRGESLCP